MIGRIEERMPLFAIRIPETINKEMPHLLKNLQSNSDRLTTWLDFHNLLKDIANGNSFIFHFNYNKFYIIVNIFVNIFQIIIQRLREAKLIRTLILRGENP